MPDARGQFIPALAEVQITRDPNAAAFPDPSQFITTCSWHLGVSGHNDTWVGQQVILGHDPTQPSYPLVYWQGTPLDGALFKTAGGSLPELQPGQQITIPLTLTPKTADYPSQSGFWILQHYQTVAEEDWYSQTPVKSSDDWYLLYPGALATVSASTSCSTVGNGLPASKSPQNTSSLQSQIPPGQ